MMKTVNPSDQSTILILDIDGVLITTPSWKSDDIDSDGYSKFNNQCVANLNKLLSLWDFEIWLSSTRRTLKTLEEFNQIFRHRNIIISIIGFLPEYDTRTRKDEILRFIKDYKLSNLLIIDDDKSLNGLEEKYKDKLILTELQKGFNKEKLEEAIATLK